MVNSGEFAVRLQKILDYYGLSATAFSEQIQFNRSTISHLLSGRNKPSLEFVMKVLEEFPEVELYWLLNGKGNFPHSADQKLPASPSSKSEVQTPPNSSIQPVKASELKSDGHNEEEIEKIVIFFKDGTFKAYN